MASYLPKIIRGNHFLLTAKGSVYWEEQNCLILSDLHLAKAGHFRKSGIGIPQAVMVEDMQRLLSDIQFYKPARLVIVGDLFHSNSNKELDFFLKWRNDVSELPITLVRGNHDILPKEWYEKAGITVIQDRLDIGEFSFVHDIDDCDDNSEQYCFSGHIHPGVIIRGVGKQSLRLPCFYFAGDHAILPAFGKFTGTCCLDTSGADSIYALAGNSVVQVS